MKKVSPKEFMKQRKPWRFSDSKIVTESRLNRTLLEYHLDSLGSRKQEQDFEEFARKLSQFEICPNLRLQTGSTGGGDSKADSETIPVSSQIQLAYFQGEDNQSKEKFAFAFSTNKDWSGKVKHDVDEISKTGNGYTKIYCITSKFARDKTRSELEKELSVKYNLAVIILDKSWILDRVFENRREKLAIEELHLGEGLEEKKDVGPLDFQKRKQFEELGSSIEDDVSKSEITIKTVDACLDMAVLAAELDDPRKYIEGLFDRALRFAKEYGTEDQYFSALYKKTWTAFFWFEDFEYFIRHYDEIEKLALASSNIFISERLNNLWTLLFTLSQTSDLVAKEKLVQKTSSLENKLTEIKNNDANKSASVQAEAMLCFMKLTLHGDKKEEVNTAFVNLKAILDEADHLIGFPFQTIYQLLNELDDIFSGQEAYEELQEHLIGIVTKGDGDISAGGILLNRGIQHLKAKRVYKAIDFLGRALRRFYKKESKDDLVYALYFLSFAYEEAGLLWAARGVLINAASYATSDFWVYSKINTMQLACYERLKMIETMLGRIGYALEWHHLHNILAQQLIKSDEKRSEFVKENFRFGTIVGLLIIKTPDQELKFLEKLPDTLYEMELDVAAYGLIYRLGGAKLLPKSFFENIEPIERTAHFFNLWLTQPAQESLPAKPEYFISDTVELKSKILGCDYKICSPNSSPEIEVGEYILSALESFLSTSMDMQAVSSDSLAIVTIKRNETLATEVKFEKKKDGKIHIAVECGPFNPHSISRESQDKISTIVSDIVLHLIGNTIVFKNLKVDLLKLFKDEEVSSRAFSFSGPLITLGNVLGYTPKRSISQWIVENQKRYPFDPQNSGKPIVESEPIKKSTSNKKNEDSFVRHDDITNVSVIRQHLWDRAGWGGIFYMVIPNRPPVMGFLFKNEEMARAIFKDWQDTFGREDKEEVIRISMIRGISNKNPTWYRAVVSTNLDKKKISPVDRIINVSRLHTLTPDSTLNLDRFVESYKFFGGYLMAPAITDEGQTQPKLLYELGIVKRSFVEKEAWEIGLNDLDVAAITEDTVPVIPKGVTNPPVEDVLKQRRKG